MVALHLVAVLAAATLLVDPLYSHIYQHPKLHRHLTHVEGEYIVVFRKRVGEISSAIQDLIGGAAVVEEVFELIHAVCISGASEELIDQLLANDDVKFVEENHLASLEQSVPQVIYDLDTSKRPPAVDKGRQKAKIARDGELWGLDRIDSRKGLNGEYKWKRTALGVDVYILDSGIRLSHTEFGKRAKCGYSVYDDFECCDYHGHGTHVPGIIGGITSGVAKEVKLIAVQVLTSHGGTSERWVISGINWVQKQVAKFGRPSVVNMSLGFQNSPSINKAVRRGVKAGMTFVVSAGNENQDACKKSPAKVAEAITVGGSDRNDQRASFSNWGAGCVDLFAPSVSIISSWATSDTALVSLSGTSMATPHVAGAAALYLEANPRASPKEVKKVLLRKSTKGRLSDLHGSPNRLLRTEKL